MAVLRLSELIQHLQAIETTYGNIELVMGHHAEGVEYSWGDEIPYEYLELFQVEQGSLAQAGIAHYNDGEQTKVSITHLDFEGERHSTDLLEMTPHSIKKKLQFNTTTPVLYLPLKNNNFSD